MKDLKEKKQVIEPNLLYNLHILNHLETFRE